METAVNPNLTRRAGRRCAPASRTAGHAADKRNTPRAGTAPAAMPRWACELFQFWRNCACDQCRRARACSGEPAACFERGWPLLPEESRVWFRVTIRAMSAGASPQAADAAGCEAARQHHLQAAQASSSPAAVPDALSPTQAAPPSPAPPAPATPSDASTAPRLRTL